MRANALGNSHVLLKLLQRRLNFLPRLPNLSLHDAPNIFVRRTFTQVQLALRTLHPDCIHFSSYSISESHEAMVAFLP